MDTKELWELFGQTFFDFCEESGYEQILRVLGGTLSDFLQNLDALHDHLSTVYPCMRAPSFRCTPRRPDGTLVLHYYSDRPGMEYMVVGLVKAVARRLDNANVTVEVMTTQGVYCPDHVQFLVSEIDGGDGGGATVAGDNRAAAAGNNRAAASDGLVDDDVIPLSDEPRISPATFCRAFPFHVVFNRQFRIVQAGVSLQRVVRQLADHKYTFSDIFSVVRPALDAVTFDAIVAHSNSVFVVRVRGRIQLTSRPPYGDGAGLLATGRWSSLSADEPDGGRRAGCAEEDPASTTDGAAAAGGVGGGIRLKGEMLYVPETDRIVFLCSPSVANLEELLQRELYLSDIPIHDSTRDLLMLSEQFRAEYELTQRLQVGRSTPSVRPLARPPEARVGRQQPKAGLRPDFLTSAGNKYIH